MLCTSSALNVQHAGISSMNLEKDYAITSAATNKHTPKTSNSKHWAKPFHFIALNSSFDTQKFVTFVY
jgi:hypothetical protein